MKKPGNTDIKRILRAAGYSWQGFRFAWRNEAAFRQELLLCVVLVPLALMLATTPVRAALLLLSLGLVLVVELINSAIEAVVDRFGAEHHELSGAAKDLGSAAVFVALTLVVIVWVLLLIF